jgi:uncharacterized protein (TIGR03435 family)
MTNTILLGLITSAGLFAQSPQFEVASLRPSDTTIVDNRVQVGLRMDGSQAHIAQFTLKEYVALAYRVKPVQVTGPDWVSTDRFDMNAKLPAGTTPNDIPEMLQALLAERFQLKVHREKKDFSVYALIQDPKNPLTIKELPADDTPPAPTVNVAGEGGPNGVSINLGNGAYYTFANDKFEFHKINMPSLVSSIERFLDRPVVDLTQLPGRYDITLPVTGEDYQSLLMRAAVNAGVQLPPQALKLIDGGSGASLFAAFQKVGLKLDSRKSPLDMIVVDGGLKNPIDN